MNGSIKLFRVAGIQVYLSWWWFLLAAYEIYNRQGVYSSIVWNVAEYLALFAIVLTHEFGHALATRQVGGTADRIMLWPLGGVAYVKPPQRPGATLWAIAAGPLVNVALAPLLYGALVATRPAGWPAATSDAHSFAVSVFWIDVGLFVFKHPARVSAGWRTDSAQRAVVLHEPRTQPDDGDGDRVLWCGGVCGAGAVVARLVAGADCGVREKQLLEQLQSGAGDGEAGEDSAARGVCVPELPDGSSAGGVLEVRELRAAVRHICQRGGVPALRDAVSHDGLPGLQRAGAVERVGGGGRGEAWGGQQQLWRSG